MFYVISCLVIVYLRRNLNLILGKFYVIQKKKMRYSKLTLFNARLSKRFFHSQLALRSNVSKNLNINQQERLNKLVQDENYKFWLGGFIEGEGSLVISIVKNDKLKFKLALQPEFNVVQHENGILVLYAFQTLTPLFFL